MSLSSIVTGNKEACYRTEYWVWRKAKTELIHLIENGYTWLNFCHILLLWLIVFCLFFLFFCCCFFHNSKLLLKMGVLWNEQTYLSFVWVDRKNLSLGITVWHHEASRVMPECDPKRRIFLSTPHSHDRLFLHTFYTWTYIFLSNALLSIADVRHIVMTLLWRLMTSLRSET